MQESLDRTYSCEHTDRRRIDIFLPDRPNGAAMLWIHGGGFHAGSKEQWREVARHFCGLGYVCGSMTYRLAPQWKFPAQVADARLGMAWFRRQAGEFGFSPKRVAATGSSAGGYLVLMLATIGPDDSLGRTVELGEAGTQPQAVVAYCPAGSVHEARRLGRSAHPKFMPVREADDPELYRIASIEDRIRGDEPPVLLLHGTEDATVPFEQSEFLCDALKQASVDVTFHPVKGGRHGMLKSHGFAEPELDKMVEYFFDKHLKGDY